MARGTASKEVITQKILDTFKDSFKYDKEIRIPIMEDGELIQIKCTLTCAKANVQPNGDTAIPGEEVKENNSINFQNGNSTVQQNIEPTQEEKYNVEKMMKALGL